MPQLALANASDTSHLHRRTEMLLQGTLLKRRDHVPGWRAREFVLQGDPDYMFLYHLPSHGHHRHPPRGLCPLGQARVRPLTEEEAGGVRHAFRVDHPWAPGVSRSKGWVLAARSRQDRDRWLKALRFGVREAEAALLREEGAVAGNGQGGHPQEEGGDDGEAEREKEVGEGRADSESVPLDSVVLPGYEEATERAVRTLLELAEPSDGWRLNFERQGVRAYKRVVQEDDRDEGASRRPRHGSFSTLKGQGIIRHHPIAVLLAVMDNTIGRQLDPQFDFGRRVRIFNQHNFLDYLKYKGIFPVAPRDMYIMCHWRLLDEDGTILIAVWSDTGTADPHPEEKGAVRAEVLTAGWVVRPLDPPHCTASACTYFSMADLKGFIPKAIVDLATDPQPMLIHTVACALDRDTSGRFKIYRHRFSGGGKGKGNFVGRYTAQDVARYVARIHRHNLPDGGESYPWLLEAMHQQQQQQEQAEGVGRGREGEEAPYETAEERRRQQQLRQQWFHQEVVARLEREAHARSLKEEVQSRAWLGCCALALALLLLSLALSLNPQPVVGPPSHPPSVARASTSIIPARVCEWLGDGWLSRLGVEGEAEEEEEGPRQPPWGPPEQASVRPEGKGERRRGRRKRVSMGGGPLPPLVA